MNRSLACCLSLALLAGATAQDQASTLFACSQDAAVVVRATVLFGDDPSPAWHRLHFRADEVLKGTLGAEFLLLEPAGACCGRSLFAMQTGDRCLLFLQRRGATLHPFGGSRGVLADTPTLVQHVRDLLAAASQGSVAAVLAENLAHAEPRIRSDAAHALAVLPQLQLSATHRGNVTAALLLASEAGSPITAPLLDIAVRLQDTSMLQDVVTTYLNAARDDQAGLIRSSLARWQPAKVLDVLPQLVLRPQASAGGAVEQRAAELLATLPVADSAPALRTMLATTTSPRVQLRVAQTLLANGVPAADLERTVSAPILQLAAKRQAQARTFRSIRPLQP